MTISMHSASAPVLVRMLGNLIKWIDKAQAHAEARKFDSVNYLGMRLAPDMLPVYRAIADAVGTRADRPWPTTGLERRLRD